MESKSSQKNVNGGKLEVKFETVKNLVELTMILTMKLSMKVKGRALKRTPHKILRNVRE